MDAAKSGRIGRISQQNENDCVSTKCPGYPFYLSTFWLSTIWLSTFWLSTKCPTPERTLRLKRLVTFRFCRGLLRMPQRLKSNGAASEDFGIHSTGVMNLTPCSCRYWRVFLPCERMHFPDKKSYRSFFKAGNSFGTSFFKKGFKTF